MVGLFGVDTSIWTAVAAAFQTFIFGAAAGFAYRVAISYEGERGRSYVDEMVLDLGIYRNIQYVTQHTIHDVHKQLKKIADEVRRWSAPGSGGQGRVPEGRARGLRPGRPALPGPPRQQPGAPRGG